MKKLFPIILMLYIAGCCCQRPSENFSSEQTPTSEVDPLQDKNETELEEEIEPTFFRRAELLETMVTKGARIQDIDVMNTNQLIPLLDKMKASDEDQRQANPPNQQSIEPRALANKLAIQQDKDEGPDTGSLIVIIAVGLVGIIFIVAYFALSIRWSHLRRTAMQRVAPESESSLETGSTTSTTTLVMHMNELYFPYQRIFRLLYSQSSSSSNNTNESISTH